MGNITADAIKAKHTFPRTVFIAVQREGVVIKTRIAPELRLEREAGKPATVQPLRDVRASIDGPNPQRVADVPKGAA